MENLATPKAVPVATAVLPRPDAAFPPEWRVIIYNDDITPMSFVTRLLKEVFRMEPAKARATMLAAHTTGKANCGSFMKSVADAKCDQCRHAAVIAGYPLRVEAEREEA